MKWRDILTYGKDTLSAINDLTDDPDFRRNLGRAGGLLALVSTALDVTDKIYDETQPPKVKAYNKLSKYVLKITKESLKDLKSDNNIDSKMIQKQIEQSFDKASDKYDLRNWDSYLPNHPAIRAFKKKIRSWLMLSNPNETPKILGLIDFELKRQASNDIDYQVFNDWWKGQKQYKDLIEYLMDIQNLNNDTFGIPNNKPLKDYYIENNVIPDIDIDTMNLKHDEVRNNYPSKGILEWIREYVDQPSSETTLVIAGSVGIGKTSAVNMISAIYASEYLTSDSDNSDNSSTLRVPIPISLKDPDLKTGPIPISLKDPDLKTEYKEYLLDHILQKIIAPEDNADENYTPILIIFDTLEKYKDASITIDKKIDQLKQHYPNTKVIITTTLDEKLLRRQIDVKKYSRLLPFNDTQLNRFFEKYKVMVGKQELTCKYAIDLGLPVEQMFRPLFAWIFSYLETSSDYGVKIVEKEKWTPKMKKAWIYMLFIHRMIAGKPREAFTNTLWREYYLQEKKILRAIAAIKQIYQILPENPIESNKVEAEIKKTVNGIQDSNFDKAILNYKESYFLSVQETASYFTYVNFLDGSINDYFLAEYYIESILNNKPLKLNIGIPSKQTIEFLDGLLDLLDSTDDDINDSIESQVTSLDKTSLLASFNYYS